MIDIKDVMKFSKMFNVLYVEDDINIQSELKIILEIFFKSVVTACNGEEGFAIYDRGEDIDLIISDIQMPILNGLEMAKKIRKYDSEIPIIITTAYSDKDYFLSSIDIKIDKYILKPIEDDKLTEVIYQISKALFEKKEYLKFKLEDEQRKLQEKQNNTIEKVTDAFISPTIIFKNKELVYFSKAFIELFNYKKIDISQIKLDSNIFDKKTNYLKSLQDYDEKNLINNKVCIKQNIGKRVFKIVKRDLSLDDGVEHMYMLVDITKEEYQKVKIESYVKALETTVVKNKKTILSNSDENKLQLSQEKTTKLRKRHKYVMTSAELVESLDSFIISELQELDDLDSDLRDSMFGFGSGDFSLLDNVSPLLKRYADEIYAIEEFEDLYISINSLAQLLSNLDISTIDESKYSEFALYLKSVADDLALWRKSIFIDQNTDNIHYLDSSLFSTALHIEMLINNYEDADTQEDDLEFF